MSIIKKHFAKTTADSKQIHDLEIYSSKRIGKSVKIKYHLYINLRGLDKYVVNTRYNTINFYSPSNIKIHSNRYQLDANRRRSIHVYGEFSINVSNDVSSIDIWYENIGRLTRSSSQDLVNHTIIPKTKVGSVSVTKNIERTLTFKWVITDQEDTYNVYDLSSFTIPNIRPTSKYYTFLGWTTVKYNNTPEGIMKAKATISPMGRLYNISSDRTYYAVWRPKRCKYRFFSYDNRIIILTLDHTYGVPTELPNLDLLSNGKYKTKGYTFSGWKSGDEIYNSEADIWPLQETNHYVNFYPTKAAYSNTLEFKFLNDDNDKKIFQKDTDEAYLADSPFTMDNALLNIEGKGNFTVTTAKPGYNLIGWSTTPLDIVESGKGLTPGKYKASDNPNATSAFTIYPVSGKIDKFDYSYFINSKLTLYAYYENSTSVYVYTKYGWKLAEPYIYTKYGWKNSIPNVYTKYGWKI